MCFYAFCQIIFDWGDLYLKTKSPRLLHRGLDTIKKPNAFNQQPVELSLVEAVFHPVRRQEVLPQHLQAVFPVAESRR